MGEITIVAEGERLDALDHILELSLPHWGPMRFEGRFQAFGGGTVTADVVTKVGSSELTGTLKIAGREEPPRVDLDLAAAYDLNACFECGCCSYVCPAGIPLTQYIAAGKKQWRRHAAGSAA